MTGAAHFSKGRQKATLLTCFFALVGYSVLVLSLNNRILKDATAGGIKSRTVTSQAAANGTLKINQAKMHTNLSSIYSNETKLQQYETAVLSSDYQSHVNEKYLLFWPHSGFSNQVLGLQRAAQIAYASKRTLVLPPVLPHHTFNRDFLKYPKFEAEVGGQCDKEHWTHYYLKLANELVHFPSFKALFNFDSMSKKTNGLKVIDMQEFSRLEKVNATDFSKWCVDIHEEDSTCNYPKSPLIYFEALDALEKKCRETQIVALGSGYQIRAPPNATKIANFNEINSYFDQIELSSDMLKLLHSIYNKLPQNYNGAHMRINDRAVCEPKDTCEETCNEEETKSAFVDFIKDIDLTKNTSHVLLGYGNEVVVKCFEYFAKEKYNMTTVYDTVENDPQLLQMLEGIKSEKDTVYLLLDQILIGLAENLNMKVKFGRKFSSTYQGKIKNWHNRRHDILASMKSSDIRHAISNTMHPTHEITH